MNRIVTSAAVVLLALPLAGAEQKNWDPPQTKQQDSPLVAAAKAANRLGKKPAFVITNETLKTMTNAHFTTTTSTHTPNVPVPQPTADMAAREKAQKERAYAEAQAAPKRKAQQEQQARTQQQYGDYENALYTSDPAAIEHRLEEQKNAPNAQQNQTPPPPPPDQEQ